MSAERLAALIQERQPCVFLTGAGISTESGIPDFRSPTGVWARYDPLQVATIDAFARDPARVWEFYALRLALLADVEPNDGHRAIAELEHRGLVRAVVTQNVDGLHQRAGSRDLIELHGALREAVCPACGAREPIDEVRSQLVDLPLPACRACGDVLKPGVVMFGELLPADAIERATALAREAALLVVVGSTLEVWPAAGLPLEARAFAIVNHGPTALDDRASLVVGGRAGETLTAVVAALDCRPGVVRSTSAR